MSHLRITLNDLSAEQLAEWLAMIDRYPENVVSWTASDDTRRPGYREAKPERAESQNSAIIRGMTPQSVKEPGGTAWHGDPSMMSAAPTPSDEERIHILDRPIDDNQNKTTTPEQDI